MDTIPMRPVLWLRDEANERALACKINEHVPLAAVVLERRRLVNPTFIQLMDRAMSKWFAPSLSRSWHKMMQGYSSQYSDFPKVPVFRVEDINDPQTAAFTAGHNPTVVVVSGTSLVRKPLIAEFKSIGILNLHTGLSPYVKGGPNCTNWCLATGQLHLIGNTVMWLDKGIDSGAIATSEFTPLNNITDLDQLHFAVMEHAHDLYLRVLVRLQMGPIGGVAQRDVGEGKTYYNKSWTWMQRIRAANVGQKLDRLLDLQALELKRGTIKTVPLQ